MQTCAFQALLVMPSNSDICDGGMTTTTGLLDMSNTRNFSRHNAAALTSPNAMKTELDSEEAGDISAEFQESGSLLAPLTGEIPAYSILLYRQGSTPEQEEGLDQFMPQASSQSLNPSSTPFKVQSFLLAQGQTQSQPFLSSGLCQPVMSSSQTPNNMVINPQQMDPVWLQILSNILAKPSDNKGENSSHLSDVYPGVCHVPKAGVPQVQGGANDLKNSCETFGAEPKQRVQLASKTPSRLPSQVKNVSLNVPKGQFVLLSPMSNSPKIQIRSLTSKVHQASTNLSFPSLNNKLNTVTSRYINLNSSGEESQHPSPLTLDHMGKESLNNSVEASKLSEYSIPLLPSSPILEHDVGGGPMRESHNMKERRRRARIKDACNLMRQLVPGMSKKTDKATVFEFSARYIHFLKSFVGANNDKDFLVKYNPY